MRKIVFVHAAVALGALVMLGCSAGERGTAGEAGPPGPSGPQGPTGQVGPAGAGLDGGVTMSDVEKLLMAPEAGANNSPYDIWKIQPGLGTVMIEYSIRLNNAWWAAHASPQANWDMVLYQVGEMAEIQEVGETTRPKRAAPLKSFELLHLNTGANSLTEIAKGVKANTKTIGDFEAAYDSAIVGCNQCHAAASSADFASYKFVKIIRPTSPTLLNIDWAGQ